MYYYLIVITKRNMRSVVASSASPSLVHWHDEEPIHLMNLTEAKESIYKAAHSALDDLKTFIVEEEHKIEDICTHFGIHDFSHHISNKNLTGATLTLYSNGHLEIAREGSKHATSFPVQLIA